VMDHWIQLPEDTGWGGPDEPMLEAYTTLGFLAQATERIALGPLVAGVHFRHPAALVKQATTLDVLAGPGRTYLGLGAGWYAREAHGLGFPFPDRGERFERLEETLRIARAMFEGDRSPIDGRHYQLAEPINVPSPLSGPRPRILVGGNGPRRTMDLIARLGDASNFLNPDPGESRRLVETIRGGCEQIGRDPAEIEMTALFDTDLRPGRMTTADLVARGRAQASEGIDHLIINLPDVHRTDQLVMIGREVVPELAAIQAAVTA
jgi:alkanesulfonate monooxygenase SsuD/methylene tetrahydromethanopterin reductase-like flavin-dependent oxidoreductase (luciferase family)